MNKVEIETEAETETFISVKKGKKQREEECFSVRDQLFTSRLLCGLSIKFSSFSAQKA